MSTNFPDAASFTGTTLVPPPAFRPGLSPDEKIDQLKSYLDGQFLAIDSMQESVASGWLIDEVRILNLTADTILANEIFTETMYVGSDQKIQFLGVSNRIEIYDEQGTPELRIRIGDLGSGADNWGLEGYDSAGNLIISIGDTVFIDGAIISNATITASKIVNVDGTTIDDSSIPSDAMNIPTLSAISANVGTLTSGEIQVSSSKIGLVIDGAGGVLISNGGDLRFTSTASGDNNFILFYDSTSTLQAGIVYDATTVQLKIVTSGTGTDILIDANDTMTLTGSNIKLLGKSSGIDRVQLDAETIEIGGSSADDINFVGRIEGNILPKTNGSGNIGDGSNKFALVRATTITSGDLRFENDYIFIEPNELDPDADPYSGLAIMNHEYKQIGFIDEHGNLQVAGKITEHVKFKKPKTKRKEYDDGTEKRH